MNKKNKILVGCLALLLALSVGYALFSDTITINGTATAKGSFDITATCEPGITSKIGTVESLGLNPEGGYDKSECNVEDDVIKTNTSFLYPGARRYYTVKFTNTGSIDSIINASKMTSNLNTCYADNKEGTNKTCVSGSNATTPYGDIRFSDLFRLTAMEDPEGNLLSAEEMSAFYNTTDGTLLLKENYSCYAYINYQFFHDCLTGECSGEFFAEFNEEFNLIFEQATN